MVLSATNLTYFLVQFNEISSSRRGTCFCSLGDYLLLSLLFLDVDVDRSVDSTLAATGDMLHAIGG